MEEFRTPFLPLQRAPLRFQGIFGVANTLYKRSFKSMLLLTLLLMILPMLVMCIGPLIGLNTFIDSLESGGMETGYEYFLGMFGFMGVASLLSVAFTFLLTPAYNGALYLELDQCVEGRQGTFGQLLKYAVPLGLKQYYTTFLTYMLIQFGAAMVLSVIFPIFFTALLIPLTMSSISSSAFPVFPMVFSFAFIYILLLFMAVLLLVFTGCIYPAAVHERIRAFKAVGRSFQLGASRFGRMLGVWSLFMLVVIVVILGLTLSPLLFLDFESHRTIATYTIIVFIITSVFTLFITPYSGCLSVALYIDAAARKPVDEHQNPYAPPVQAGASSYGIPPVEDFHKEDAPPSESIYGKPMPRDDIYEKPAENNPYDETNHDETPDL